LSPPSRRGTQHERSRPKSKSIVKEQKTNQVTKLHTFSFFEIPVILQITAQTGHKQSSAAFPLRQASSLPFFVFSYSAKGKSHFM